MSTNGTTVATLSLAGMLTAQPFGISVETIAVGTCFSIIGVVGRAAFELQKSSEGTSGMTLGKIFGWLGAGFVGAPFATILYLVVLKLANIQSDSIVIIGLLFFGFSGPRMITWLINTAIGQINKRSGLNIPSVGPSPSPADAGVKP